MAQAILRALANRPPEPSREERREVETKVLRVGIIEEGRIVEEQILTRRTPVSVGHSERCTFVVPSQDLPSRFELFERRGAGYRLCFTEAMRGRVARGGATEDLDELRRTGKAKPRGRVFQLDLDESSRGKIVIGGYTLLFQFVTPPPAQPTPQLPASVRGRHLKNIDWVFTAILAVSFLAQVGLVTYLVGHDWPVRNGFELMPDHLRDYVFASRPTVEEIEAMQRRLTKTSPADASAAADRSDGEPESAEPAAASDRRDAGRRGGAGAVDAEARARAEVERRARIRDALDRVARASIIGSFSTEEGGVVADVMNGGGVDGDLDRIIQDAEAVRMASATDRGLLRRPDGSSDGSRDVATIDRLKTRTAAGTVDTEDIRTEREVGGKVGTGPVREDPRTVGDISQETVRRIVGRSLGGIKRCYERVLPRDPTLSGRVTIAFTIGAGGRVVSARATENSLGSPEVAACVERQFRSMRFPEPRGGPAYFAYPFIFAPQH